MSVETLAPSPAQHRVVPGPRAEGHVHAPADALRHGGNGGHVHRHEARLVKIGPSVLRMSLGARLALAAALLAPLWIAVALVVG